MKKLSLYIFLVLLCFNFLNKANAIPKKGNGQGDLALSEDIIKEFHSYITTRTTNNPLNFFITADHKNVFIEIRKNTNYKQISGSGPIARNKKKCEQKFKQECFLFANQRVVVWNNGINPIDSKKLKIKSKTSYDELIIKLNELGFIETKEQKIAKEKKLSEEKGAKQVTWQVFVKLKGEMGNNSNLPGFNAKETSKIKSIKDQINIIKKTTDKALHKCKNSNVKWTISLRGNKICTVTVVKYFDEENPNNNNKYVDLSGIKFDDLIISINGLEKLTPEKIEEIEASQKKLSEEKVANAKNMCNVSKPIYNWTMCLGTQIDNQNKFKYVGQWKDGDFHGQGTWTYESGEEYVGEWKFGSRNGQGTEIFPDGYKYVGEFKNDKRNGQGTETYPDGWTYTGEFKDDKRNGQGTAILVNGKKKSGVWQDENLLTKKEEKTGRNYVYQYALSEQSIFNKSDPTTFKQLTFKKEINIRVGYFGRKGMSKEKPKNLRGFSFIAEYEEDIKLELFIEYDKSIKDLEKAEKKALYFANMFGQMPHFLKIYTRKIYIHRDLGNGDGVWWAPWNKNEFHITEGRCGKKYYLNYGTYSECARTMIHELAHVLQRYTSVISPSKWGQARKLDNKKYCSKYAKKNNFEDFAESLVCWVFVNHKKNIIKPADLIKIYKFIPNRLKFFDEMNFNIYPLQNS